MVSIKGRQDGLLVTLDEGQDWAEQIVQLETQLESQQAFFAGGRLALDIGGRLLSIKDIQDLQARLARRNIALRSVVSDSKATQAAARYLNLETEIKSPSPQDTTSGDRESPAVAEKDGWLIRRTLRSGQKIHHPGHVTIIGDVNPGAEIIAGGHVIVWGRLQGMVHAGAMGDDSAVVCALDLSPTQLRIGNHIARSPEEKRRRKVRPEIAIVLEGRIVAEPWKGEKERRK